ncbi:MAG: synthase gamma subunit [Edaphobacter sp.]|jgi:F-type H+-transporting ATPase subunit gamma|nr:synthase gamma subunit [Edaphobacter sp.]
MANVLDLRRRIRSVKNTRQITKAMKMVSAAKLRRAQERAMLARPYARMISNVLESLVRRTGDSLEMMHPLLVEREEKNVLVIVVAGDKGFAGAFNSNIIKAAQGFVSSRRAQGQNVDIEPVGRKARDTFRKRYPAAVYEKKEEHYDNDLATHFETIRHRAQPIEITGDHPTILLKIGIDEVSEMARSIVERYTRAEIDSVYVVYNEFKSVISQRVVVEKLLPIRKLGSQEITVAEEMTEEQIEAAGTAAKTAGISLKVPEESVIESEAKKFGTADVDYIFDQSPERLFRHLMPKYITTQLFHAMLESVAAEHAARMTAMDSATNNAGDMIDALSLTMNRVRQAAITKEIIEIVSGAAAL